ncbi:hypothetical protein SAMN05216417_10634 [Nitrosospira multiformis]|uniref:Uncharacterized protein n=1 Tax=Nitrosospira multiformis TaxID=1231 RepID=A0A1I7GWC5_9PROT|nr:hypothetical protein SAMN05216417_10634 [Nitrosospira multiformis]
MNKTCLECESFGPNEESMAAMMESLNAKPGDFQRFNTVEESMAYLNAPDDGEKRR